MPRKKKEELPQIGDFCYLITDAERQLRQVIKIKVDGDGAKYKLACGTEKTWHYLIEMTGDGMERTPIKGFKNVNKEEPKRRNSKPKDGVVS